MLSTVVVGLEILTGICGGLEDEEVQSEEGNGQVEGKVPHDTNLP